MKKYLLLILSLVLFASIDSSSLFAQKGGAFSYLPAKVQRVMMKNAVKQANSNKLKSGAGGSIECLVPYICATSSDINLVPNPSWGAYKTIIWEALTVTGLDGDNNIIGDPFPIGTNVVTYNPITFWNFHPGNIPLSENGQFVQIKANLYNNLGINFASFSDVVMFYRTPEVFSVTSSTGSVCAGQPYIVSLSSSTAPVGPNIITSWMSNTAYALKKDGVATGDTLIGTGGQIDFSVLDAGSYTIEAINMPEPILGSGDKCSVGMSGSTGVTINPLPTVTATSNSPICANNTLNLMGGVAGLSYAWTGPNGFMSAAQNGSVVNATTASSGTYTLVGTDSNGCVDSAKTVALVNPLPLVTLTGNTAPCINVAGNVYITEAGMSNYQWIIPSGGTKTAGGLATDNTVTITWNTVGTKTLTVNYNDVNACSATTATSLAIDVKPLPIVTIIGDATGCINVSETFTTEAGMSNYSWTIDPSATLVGGALNSNTITLQWATTGAKPVTVTYSDGNNCNPVTPASKSITINDVPTPIILGSTTVCAGSSQTYTTQSGAGISGWSWSVTNGTIVGASNTASIQVDWSDSTTPTTGTVSVNYLNINGCTAPSPTVQNISIDPQPIVTISGSANVCAGSTNIYTTEAGMASYVWNISSGGTITAGAGTNSVTVKWNTAGAQTLSATYNTLLGCPPSTPLVYNVNVQAAPIPTITGSASACINSSGNIYTTEVGMSNYVWSILGGTIDSGVNTSTVSVTWTATGSQSISVNYDNALGCPAAAPITKSVVVNALPVPVITGSATACANSTSIFTTDLGMSSYVWSVAGGIIQSGQGTSSVTILWGAANPAASVSVTYVNLSGCSPAVITSRTINVFSVNTPTITGDGDVCLNESAVSYSTEVGMSGYIWTIDGGTITSGAGTNSVLVTWNVAGSKSISVTYINGNGCLAVTPTNFPVTVNALPVPTITGPANACIGGTSVTYSTDAGMSGYIWTVSGGGTIASGAGTNTIMVNWNALGAQTVQVTYTNGSGCNPMIPTQQNVTVASLPVPTIAGNNAGCQGVVSTYSTEAGMSSYLWTVSAAGTIQSGQGTNSINVLWNVTGATESISVTYSNGCFPLTPTVKNINVGATPVVSIIGLSSGICVGASNIDYVTQAGKSNYVWSIIGGTITSGVGTSAVKVTWSNAGNQSISVNYDDINGCSAPTPTTLNVTVSAIPSPTITGSATVCQGAANVLYSTESGQNGYQWTVSSGGQILSGLGTDQILVLWNNSGVQSVSVNYMNAGNCMAPAATVYPVTVNAIPSPSITGSASVCLNSSSVYTTEIGAQNYVWSVTSNGTIISGQGTNSVTIQWNGVGSSESVSVTYSDAIGCAPILPTTFGVNVHNLPIISFGGSTDVCTSSTVTYKAPVGSSNWQWSISGGSIVNVGAPADSVSVIWPVTPGAGSVSLNFTDINGCTAAAPLVKPVNVGTQTVPTITGNITACLGDVNVSYFTESGKSGYVWVVSSGGTITSGQGTQNIIVDWTNSAGNQTVSVNYTDPLGCAVAGPVVQNVSVSALPISEMISGSTNICLNQTLTYSIPAGYANVVWSVSANGSIIGANNGNSIQVLWSGLGAGFVDVLYTNTNGCFPLNPSTLPITVNTLPTPTITFASATVCAGSTNVSYTTESGMSNYTWIVTGGTIASGANSNSILVNWINSGIGTVSVNYDNGAGCAATIPTLINITVISQPLPIISGATDACINTSQLYSTASGGAITNYLWTVTDGTITGGIGTNVITVLWTSSVSPSVKVSYDENGCTGTSSVYPISVHNLPLTQVAVTSPANGEYCVGEAGVDIILTGSEPTVTYELRNATNTLIGTVSAGISPVMWSGIPAGTYSVIGIGSAPSSCSTIVASGIVAKSNPLPTSYSIDPSNTVVGCNGGAGYVVGLVDSDLGFTYQLLLNGGAVGASVPGTGSAITFGAQFSFGTYTVLATNDLTGCNLVMSNSFVMNPDVATTTYNLIANPPSGAYCDLPSGGVDISLSGSDVGVNYILRMGGADIDTVAGTGSLINFARVKSVGSYSIEVATLSGCRAPMTGNVNVQPITPPQQYNVVASSGGFFCSGDVGASLQLSGQQAGIVYQLFQFGNPLPIDTQTGLVDNPTLPLLFSGLYSDGTYSVLANHPLVAGCFIAMNNNVTVSANPLPISYVVTFDGDFCVGGSTNINLSNSDISAQYRVVNIDDNSTSAWTLGSGLPLSFSVSNTGNYTVEASNTANGITCTNWMQDTVSVTAQNLPSDVSVVTTGGTGCDDGVVITILSSQAGVTYSVVDQVLGTVQGTPIVGNGLDISFAPIVDNGKIYDIHANLNGCERIVGSPVNVNISGVITKQLVTGGGTICSGGSATIGLGDTEVGVQYNLYIADTPGGTSSLPPIASLVGDGLSKSFAASINSNSEYFVEGSSGGCVNEMANRVVVSLNPTINAQIIVSPNDTVCANSAVVFTGRGGDRYTFYLNNSSLGMAADSTLSLASVVNEDQIKVFVENSSTGCSAMSLPITMTVVDQISQFTLQSVSGGQICPSTTDSLYLSGSEWGVEYILYDQTDSPIDTIVGNNGIVYFANISTGIYYVIGDRVGGSPCGTLAMNDTVTVVVSTVPTIFDITPTGVENGCLGGNIDLNGSELGITYHLVRDSIDVVASTSGTGVAISFVKPLVAGNYTIQAIYGNGCSVYMNGNLDIINPPTENIYTLTSNPLDGRYCDSGVSSGVTLTLDNSDATKTYSLYRDGVSVKDTVSIGGAITFGSYTTPGFYSVLIASSNGCFDQMDSVIHVVPIAPPTAFTLQADNNGSYCVNGGLGVGIQLVGQQDDVVYELYLGGIVVGATVGIDNNVSSVLPFQNLSNGSYLFTSAGSYSVVAHYILPAGCDVNMINSVNVVPTADPTNFIVTTAGDFCEGGSTIINVNGSETTVDYRWINITTTDAGSWTVGTGGLLQFSGITISGDYIVEARSNLGASCLTTLLDTVSVTEIKIPNVRNYTVVNGGTCSDASLIIVENAELGVVYTLVDALTNVPTSISFVGSTNLLDTMQIIDSNGKYYIQAARMACAINFPGAPFIDINNADPATVKKHIVTPIDASICNGELGVRFGLQTNTAGIRYTLYWSLDNVKDAIPQDTIDSFIGSGLPNQQFNKLGKKRGTYYVLGESASCENYMINDPELVVNPLPTAFMVTGSGMYCDPDPNPVVGGAQIGVEHQEDRVLYTLQQYDMNDDYVNDVAEFRGSLSGLPFVFGSYKESGANNIYKVVAIDTITGCTSNMNGRVEVQLTPFIPDLPVVDLGVSNGRFCQGTNGAPIVIGMPQIGLTYQVILEKLPIDSVILEKVALTADPLTLGYVEVGNYHVNSSWGGDACIQTSTSFEITQRVPIAFNVDYDCGVTDSSALSAVLNAGHITLDSSEIGITYLVYDSLLNVVGFNSGIDAPLTFNGLYGAGKYSVQGTCSPSATPVFMANNITIAFPIDTFNLSIKNRPSLTGVRGDTILIDGFETNATYYSRIETWVDTFAIGALAVTPPLEFPTDSAGMYHILAINDHNCGAVVGKTATILETMLVANNDTLRFGKSDLIGSILVGDNDFMDRGRVDKEGPEIAGGNIVYRLVHGGLNPDITLDSITGAFIYVKSPTFYGKDSIRYELVNKNVPNRRDTALVWIFVGNKDIGTRTFLIPNAFSPNGDGINDYFVISTIYAYSTEESELEVYNRWGSLVYRSKDKSYDNRWDGHANANLISVGEVLPNGTYFYIYKVTFNINGVLNKEEYNGFIELRR